MNALELANSIDEYLDSILEEAIHPIEEVLNESITMLRQQQAKLTKYELRHAEQRDRIAFLEAQVYGGTTK